MSRRYILDANHLGAALAEKLQVRSKIVEFHAAGWRFGTCVPMLFELEVGIRRHATPEQLRKRLQWLLKIIRIWPLTSDMIDTYGQIRSSLRDRGRVLSQFDMVIGAMAFTMGARILSTDKGFDALPEIRTENWVN